MTAKRNFRVNLHGNGRIVSETGPGLIELTPNCCFIFQLIRSSSRIRSLTYARKTTKTVFVSRMSLYTNFLFNGKSTSGMGRSSSVCWAFGDCISGLTSCQKERSVSQRDHKLMIKILLYFFGFFLISVLIIQSRHNCGVCVIVTWFVFFQQRTMVISVLDYEPFVK